jgi:hypothetical protein
MSVPIVAWSGQQLVSRTRVAEVLGCCTATVSRNLAAYAFVVGGLVRYDLGAILRDHALGTDEEST